jgi:hypothetical protein
MTLNTIRSFSRTASRKARSSSLELNLARNLFSDPFGLSSGGDDPDGWVWAAMADTRNYLSRLNLSYQIYGMETLSRHKMIKLRKTNILVFPRFRKHEGR